MNDEDEAIFDLGMSHVTNQTTTAFALGRPYPNPCITTTQIRYSVPAGDNASEVSLAVYDLSGRKIRNLSGSESGMVQWDCRNEQDQPVSSGVYFIQLRWKEKHASKRVLLVR